MVHIRHLCLFCCDMRSASYFLQFQCFLVISHGLFFCVCVVFFFPPLRPGVQFPTSAEWPRSHSWGYEPGDKNTLPHSRHEAEIWYAERILLHQELTCPQHNKRRDRPNDNFSLQGVWQVSVTVCSTVSPLPVEIPDQQCCEKTLYFALY